MKYYDNRDNPGKKKKDKSNVLSYTKLTNKNYVELAKNVIETIKPNSKNSNSKGVITTTKLRSILSLNSEIYNMVNRGSETLSEEVEAKLQYLKVKIIYEMGREESVKTFCENAHLTDCINDIDGTKTSYILFARYLEALVAYRKYIIGHDK